MCIYITNMETYLHIPQDTINLESSPERNTKIRAFSGNRNWEDSISQGKGNLSFLSLMLPWIKNLFKISPVFLDQWTLTWLLTLKRQEGNASWQFHYIQKKIGLLALICHSTALVRPHCLDSPPTLPISAVKMNTHLCKYSEKPRSRGEEHAACWFATFKGWLTYFKFPDLLLKRCKI